MQKPYVPREIEPLLTSYLGDFPVVGLTGPRQSGKSTLLRHLLSDTYTYVTFDDYAVYDLFYADPERFMKTYANNVIFDEAQLAPELFRYIKLAVDNDRSQYGKFIVTGSSQFALLEKASESLAGRIGLLSLSPFVYTELPEESRSQSLYMGTYPELTLRNFRHADRWYASYLTTYLEKDVSSLFRIGDMRDFRRFISLLAARTSQLLNMSTFARELGVAVSTIKKWISILEASYIIFLLPTYHANRGKRIVKSPKVYFLDTGLAAYLTASASEEAAQRGPLAGALFENYVISDVYKQLINTLPKERLFFYRESSGLEVDLIVTDGHNKVVVEVKNSYTFRSRMTEGIETLLEEGDRGYLVFKGDERPLAGPIKIVPYTTFLGEELSPLKIDRMV